MTGLAYIWGAFIIWFFYEVCIHIWREKCRYSRTNSYRPDKTGKN
jgi:hypothetical protein